MNLNESFNKHFSTSNLKRIFEENIAYSGATGIDNLNQFAFRPHLDKHINIISCKVLNHQYQFTKYKLKLISKGRGKVPREISIPTVRDRVLIRAMCEFLSERFKTSVNLELPQNVVRKIKHDLNNQRYTHFIKLDVSNFFPSLIHKELISRLSKRIRDKGILQLVERAIATPTVAKSSPFDQLETKGIPQGLAISNILAAIYMVNIDRHFNNDKKISYYRYVDDVLILCGSNAMELITKDIIKRFKKIGLEVHDPIKAPDKSNSGAIFDRFDYLGYQFESGKVTVRKGSIDKLKESLVGIFTTHKHAKKPNEAFLIWRLNLRVTGCVYERKSKGWLFFFSEINDESLLHILDHYLNNLIKRFGLSIKIKKFVRSFKEITFRKYETNYVPNFDKYDTDMQKQTLVDFFGMNNVGLMNDDEIEFEFKKKISKQIKDLQTDIKDFS